MPTDSRLWGHHERLRAKLLTGGRKPSAQDLEMTRRFASGLKVMDIMLYDHFTVGNGDIYSVKMNGHNF